MDSMCAVWISQSGGPEVLQIREVVKPQPGLQEVLIKVRASALNRADLLQRQGKYPAPAGFSQEIPGLEFAGEIAETGTAVRMWKPGQRVFGLLGGAAHADYVVTHERMVAAVPGNLTWEEAAAVPEAFITAHDALWIQAALRPAETVLIHSVGSGVGLAATQLARAIGAVPFGTSRTPEKIAQAKQFGLEDGSLVRESFDDLLAQAEKWTAGRGINVVIDLAGGPYVKASQKLMALKGRMVLVGTVAGGNYELDSRFVMGKRLQIRGTVLRSRTLEEKIQVTQCFAAEVVPLIEKGMVRPAIDSSFRMADISKAHQRLESNQTFGKVVITMD
ncbi:MAG TPA: NAD(P)H-quinone oxidoreductase [Candidatus Angelobacter sp.]|nr:NAD(P)H-quinone oxidoreductase [Candidatus Angelobacter sp.]